MIILLGSKKGGCGKSTTAVNLAAWLAGKDYDVVLVDTDTQSTASNWAADRAKNPDLPPVHCVQKYDEVRNTLLDLDRRYDFVVVDTPGADSREMRQSMTAAHILIVPVRPSQADLDTLPSMQDIIISAKDFNPEMKVYGILTMASPNPVVSESDDAKEIFEDYPVIKLIDNVVIRDRKAYRDALSVGMGVTECDNDKARFETNLLFKGVLYGKA